MLFGRVNLIQVLFLLKIKNIFYFIVVKIRKNN